MKIYATFFKKIILKCGTYIQHLNKSNLQSFILSFLLKSKNDVSN